MTNSSSTMTATEPEKKKGRKRAIIAFGSLLGIAALATSAAFTDFANLNLGSNGIGTDSYNIQVVGTDPVTGEIAQGTWQEADTTEGAPIAIVGAETMFPGSAPITVDIPVRNTSANIASSLGLGLVKIPDAGQNVTDPNYLSSLRFDIEQPATSRNAVAFTATDKTFAELASLALNELDGLEESNVTITIRLLDQATSGAAYEDNALNGKKAFIQAQFTGSSVS